MPDQCLHFTRTLDLLTVRQQINAHTVNKHMKDKLDYCVPHKTTQMTQKNCTTSLLLAPASTASCWISTWSDIAECFWAASSPFRELTDNLTTQKHLHEEWVHGNQEFWHFCHSKLAYFHSCSMSATMAGCSLRSNFHITKTSLIHPLYFPPISFLFLQHLRHYFILSLRLWATVQ